MAEAINCLFCMDIIVPYNVVPTDKFSIQQSVPNFSNICNFLEVKFDGSSDRWQTLFEKLRRYFCKSGTTSFSSDTKCDSFLCLSCFEMVDQLAKLLEQLKEIQAKIDEKRNRIKAEISRGNFFIENERDTVGEDVFGFSEAFQNSIKGWLHLNDNSYKEGSCSESGIIFDYENFSDCTRIRVEPDDDEDYAMDISPDPLALDDDEYINKELQCLNTEQKFFVEDGNIENGRNNNAEYVDCFDAIKNNDDNESYGEAESENESSDICKDDDPTDFDYGRSLRSRKPRIIRKQKKTVAPKRTNRSKKSNNDFEVQNFPCRFCSQSFLVQNSLTYHLLQKHRKQTTITPAKDSLSSTASIAKSNKLLTCHLCVPSNHKVKTFKSLIILNNHIKIAHTENDDKKYKCERCGKGFVHKVTLKNHIERVHDKIRLQCPICPKSFQGKSLLREHIELHEQAGGGPAVIKCKFCDKEYESKSAMRNHIVTQHEQHEPVPCEKCGKTFPTFLSLRTHRRICEIVNCNLCSMTFKNESQLNVHKRAAHITSD